MEQNNGNRCNRNEDRRRGAIKRSSDSPFRDCSAARSRELRARRVASRCFTRHPSRARSRVACRGVGPSPTGKRTPEFRRHRSQLCFQRVYVSVYLLSKERKGELRTSSNEISNGRFLPLSLFFPFFLFLVFRRSEFVGTRESRKEERS